jgi:putative transposase
MAPLLRKSWSLKGHRPEFPQQGGRREKVSVAGAILLSPQRDRLELFYKTLVNEYFDHFYCALFLEALLKMWSRSKIMVVWDGGPMHKGEAIRELKEIHRQRLYLEKLPPYAPKLNPIEPLWGWLKYGRLCNYAPFGAERLNKKIVRELNPVCADQALLTGIWKASELPLPRHYFSDPE